MKSTNKIFWNLWKGGLETQINKQIISNIRDMYVSVHVSETYDNQYFF